MFYCRVVGCLLVNGGEDAARCGDIHNSVLDKPGYHSFMWHNLQKITRVNKLPTTLRVPYQFDPSSSPSSSPSSYSDHGPLVDISCGVFRSRLKTALF